jgi:hypothetical protein
MPTGVGESEAIKFLSRVRKDVEANGKLPRQEIGDPVLDPP